MNNGLKNLFIFATGAAVGAVVSWKLLEEKYRLIAKEEIESVKKVYSYRKPEGSGMKEIKESFENLVAKTEEKLAERTDYSNMVKDLKYTNEEKGGDDLKTKPYVITPEEFGEIPEYESVSLTYYADGVMTDEFDEPLDKDDVANSVGNDATNHFGEYEDDSVFVRNDERRCDYEILLDTRRYTECHKPHSVDK